MGKELGEEQGMGAMESPGERRRAKAEYVRILRILLGFQSVRKSC